MNKKLVIITVAAISVILTAGVVQAAGFATDWLKVGAQDVGGVTWFNGTIINETTGDNDIDNPVTFGDNVRIDGRVWRGATAGTSDTMPFIVNDNMEVTGSLTVGNLIGTGVVSSSNLASSAVTSASESNTTTDQTTTSSGGNYATAETITMTTDDSNLFCIFSGYGTTNVANSDITIGISLDGEIFNHTIRRETMGNGNGFLNMATNAIFDVSAGEHTISLLWNTSAATTGTLHANTFDCIELKK